MSLLTEAMESFVYIDKITTPDGYGGVQTTYQEGAGFDAAAVLDTSMEARIGNIQGVTGLYTITTPKKITLEYHDIVKRKSDGKIFRIKSDGDDKKTPDSAKLNMRQVVAEEWSIPNG